jgi:hypothetical protein
MEKKQIIILIEFIYDVFLFIKKPFYKYTINRIFLMLTKLQKQGFFLLLLLGVMCFIFFYPDDKKKKNNSGLSSTNNSSNNSGLSSTNNSPNNSGLSSTNNSTNNISNPINNSTNSLSNNSVYEPNLNNNISSSINNSTNNSNKPDLTNGTSLICPPNTQKGGLICYNKCRSNEQWDGTHTCYTNPPANWKGGQTLTHLQHNSYWSQAGLKDIVPTKCTNGRELHAGLCYYNPDKTKYEYQSPGLYKNKCRSGYYWNGTTCWQDPKRTGITLYAWKWGDPAFNYSKAGNRCKAANPQGCTQTGAIWYPNCPPGQRSDGTSCWRDVNNYGGVRSVIGTLPSECHNGKERHGRLCYKKCKKDYERRAGNIEKCQTVCPPKFSYIGVGGCQKPSRMISSKGTIGSIGICPSTHPIKLKGTCYKKK